MFSGGIERDFLTEIIWQEFAGKVDNTLIKCPKVKFNFYRKFKLIF